MAYRVLSLDGGGPWAVIQAMALIDLFSEDTSGWDVLRQFDLAAANSGGSIVLGCLVQNMTLGAIQKLFIDDTIRQSMFQNTSSTIAKIVEDVVKLGPKYSAAKKLDALREALPGRGDMPLNKVVKGLLCHRGTGEDVRLLITGFDYDRCRATFFRSMATGGANYGTGEVATVTLAQAIQASTNAPVNYFDAPATFPPALVPRYWDGAIAGFNNPVLAGVIEAISATKDFTQVIALSIGTGTVTLPWPLPGQEASPYVIQQSKSTLVRDLEKVASSILDDPPDLATYAAHVMTGSGAGVVGKADSQIIRMNPMISPTRVDASVPWTPPGQMTEGDFTTLANIPMDAPDAGQMQMITDYAKLWLSGKARNQPIRMDGTTLLKELGQDWYGDAKNAWIAISGWDPPAPPV